MARRLEKRPDGLIVGGNIGKNKGTPNEEAVNDYVICFERLADLVDYFVVNVSSPNTPGLRSLQEKGPLTRLLGTLQEKNQGLGKPRPLLLKIAPDLTHPQMDDIIEIAGKVQLSGLIATNTTTAREPLRTEPVKVEAKGAGGLSGKPIYNRSTDVVQYFSQQTGGRLPIIGVGGIDSADTARAKMAAGASLVQIYTGLIYKGPGLVKSILQGLTG
jgi:dihydroorotate dehydrogenase